ncbi:RagB/SusD family nutrient uptake outer membrane protein, partial [Pseudoxanthomonas sp. SGD-10]
MKKNLIKYMFASLVLLSTSGCKDDFLQEKRDLTGVNEEVFTNPALAQAYVDYIYGLFLPANNGTGFIATNTASDNGSYNNVFSQTTDELAGETDFNKEWSSILNTQNHANRYFGQKVGSGVSNNVWTRLKQINTFLAEIDKHGIEEDTRNKLKGQMYFWRAWQYFELVRLYGGVPLILEPQNPKMENIDVNSVPRSKTSECIEQICADLDMAKDLLPGKWPNQSADWGRITSGAAAALKGRVLLTWASPLFNPNDDVSRWQRSYDANLEAKNILEQNDFRLFEEGGVADGKAWGDMWLKEVGNPEAVIVFGFNTAAVGGTFTRNSGWEQVIRPRSIGGNGSISPTKQIVDAFPMKDGKATASASSTYTYDPNKFYKNRDPRFYKTFAYNGS